MTIVKVNRAEKQNKETIHKVGNWYEHKDTKELYVLCTQGYSGVTLICVNDGECWTSQANDYYCCADVRGQMKEILDKGEFELIKSVTITKD